MPRKQTAKKTTTAKKTETRAKTGEKSTKITLNNPGDFVSEVRERAYEMYMERGQNHGNDLNDWLKAEKEVKNKYSHV